MYIDLAYMGSRKQKKTRSPEKENWKHGDLGKGLKEEGERQGGEHRKMQSNKKYKKKKKQKKNTNQLPYEGKMKYLTNKRNSYVK